jgi:hypothetical protein
MRHHIRLIIAGLLLSSTVVLGADSPGRLVGTWQLVSRVDRDASGKTVPDPSLGPDPIGYLIYDGSGHVAVQLMAGHRSSDPCQVTAPAEANNLAHVGGYDAYFGRYEVDLAARTVTHILEGALSQPDVGRRLVRRFKLDGDTLTIEFEPAAKGRTRTLIWRRVSP